MKALSTLFLVLISLSNSAFAISEIYSRVCSYRYTEGPTVRMASGQIVTRCIDPKTILDEYPTSPVKNCQNGFADGVIIEGSGEFDEKVCIRISSIGEIYETAADFGCIKGFRSDNVKIYLNPRFPSKFCVRGH